MVYDSEHYLAKQKAMSNPDQTTPDSDALEQLQQPPINPNEYLSEVFKLYRQGDPGADYRGRRDEDQQFIAEFASEEADEHFDQLVLSVGALTKVVTGKPSQPMITGETRDEDVRLGEFDNAVSIKDMRDAWRQLWVGMNVLTNRLHRDNPEFKQYGYPEIFEMSAENKKQLIDTLFGNFQELNALRFGAKGSGLMRKQRKFDPQTLEPVEVRFDKDKAQTERQLNENAAKRRYRAGTKRADTGSNAVHPAGKMTPEEFVQLRKQYPEVDMDQFAYDAAYLKDMASYYAGEENH